MKPTRPSTNLGVRQVILLFAAIVLMPGSLLAAHERPLQGLLDKLEQSTQAAQRAINNRDRAAAETALGNAFVQGNEAFIHVQRNLGARPISVGTISDPTDRTLGINNTGLAVNRMVQSAAEAKRALARGDFQGVQDNLFWAITGADVAAYHFLQNGRVNNNSNTLPGIGAVFEIEGNKAYMAGTIDDRIGRRVNSVIARRTVRTIVLVNVPGSFDDASNTSAALAVRRARLDTHLLTGGNTESGGSDFFLAGVNRSIAPRAFYGVHSWSGGGTSGFALRNQRNNQNHFVPFLNFYRQIGIPDSFYFFSIQFRPEDMHYMTAAELQQHGVVSANTPNVVGGGTDTGGGLPGIVGGGMPGTNGGGGTNTGGGIPGIGNPVDPFDKLVGTWTEVRQRGPNKTMVFLPNGQFTEAIGNRPSWSGTAKLNGNSLRLDGSDGDSETLVLNIGQNRIGFPGRTFFWTRVSGPAQPNNGNGGPVPSPIGPQGPFGTEPNQGNLPQPPAVSLDGTWLEVRTDGQPNRVITIANGRLTARIQQQVSQVGTVQAVGQQLIIAGNDGAVDIQRFSINGDRMNFFDPRNVNEARSFYWLRLPTP